METEQEHVKITLDTDPQIVRIILDLAEYLGKCPKEGQGNFVVRPNVELVREAADLVFLTMSLIAEKRG